MVSRLPRNCEGSDCRASAKSRSSALSCRQHCFRSFEGLAAVAEAPRFADCVAFADSRSGKLLRCRRGLQVHHHPRLWASGVCMVAVAEALQLSSCFALCGAGTPVSAPFGRQENPESSLSAFSSFARDPSGPGEPWTARANVPAAAASRERWTKACAAYRLARPPPPAPPPSLAVLARTVKAKRLRSTWTRRMYANTPSFDRNHGHGEILSRWDCCCGHPLRNLVRTAAALPVRASRRRTTVTGRTTSTVEEPFRIGAPLQIDRFLSRLDLKLRKQSFFCKSSTPW